MTATIGTRQDVSAKDYLRWLFTPSDRVAILVRNRNRGETAQRIASVSTIVEEPFMRWLQLKNREQASDVFVGMNPLKPEARARTKDDILEVRHLYVDLDRDAVKSLSAIEASNLVPNPNAVLQSSPGKLQVVWKVSGFDQDQAETMLRALARKFDGDVAATDSTRVLRIPGFQNHKYEEAFPVRAELRDGRVHCPNDFRLKTQLGDHDYRAQRPSVNRPAIANRTTLSQSEHDWAFAKRSLAKGTAPDEVVRQISGFRAGDKHNPGDYARRTVTKALAELQRSPDGRVEGSHSNLGGERD